MNTEFLSLITTFLLAILLLLMPYLVFPTVPFGVRIPLAYVQDPAVTSERRRYTLRLSILGILLILVDIAAWSLYKWQAIRPFSIILMILGGWVIYYLSHHRLAQVKADQNWFDNAHQAIMVDSKPRSKTPSRLFWILLALPAAVTLATVLAAAWRYPALPGTLYYSLPQSFGEWTLAKTPLSAVLPVMFQLLVTALAAAMAWLFTFGAQPIDVEDPQGSRRYHQAIVQVIQALLLLLALGLDCALLLSGLASWGLLQVSTTLISVVTFVPMAAWLIIAPLLLIGVRAGSKTPAKTSGYVNRDDDRFWKLGVIYVNRDDPSLLVSKRFGVGRTLNFGNPLAWILSVAIILFILYRVLTRS